nr:MULTISPECIES: hypothetical protein [unclassified Providencia]
MFYGYVTNIIGYTSNQTDNRSVLLTWTVTGPRNPEILTFLFEGVDAYAVSLFIATEHKSGSDMMLTIIDADEQATRPQNSRKVNDFYISPTGYSASKLEVTKKIEQPTQGYITEVDYIAKNLGRDDYFIFFNDESLILSMDNPSVMDVFFTYMMNYYDNNNIYNLKFEAQLNNEDNLHYITKLTMGKN